MWRAKALTAGSFGTEEVRKPAFTELGQWSTMKYRAAVEKFMKNYKGRMFKT